MRRAVVFKGTVSKAWMTQSKIVQMTDLEENVGSAMETKQKDIRAQPWNS